uniref:N-alpha-acetyltransferase 20 n=1 Tax=Anthurium amnicola TaxID=1678845 RepID=A0A1D1XXS5_9ARAE
MVTMVVEQGNPILIREFDAERDCPGAEVVERMCEVGSSDSGKIALFTDLLGDPICRIRHSPAFLMLVAETGGARKEIVGLIRGCIKTVTCGKRTPRNGKPPVPLYTKLAYILGLRVSPSHRRMGIGLKLVTRMEEWFREKGAEYSYMATENDNEASIGLFTGRCGYSKFRTPSILVQPVFAHRLRVPRRVSVLRLSPADAESLYRRRFSTVEFFPRDIDAVLNNPLSLGTFLAVAREGTPATWAGAESFLADPPESWAVLSVWNCKDVFRLQVCGASRPKRWLATTSRVVDRAFPWLGIPSVPNLFQPFGFYFLYGVGGQGPDAARLVAALCAHAHNLSKEGGCRVVATEVASCEPLRVGIPHWRRLSCAEDLWCVKRLGEDYSDGTVGDWTKSHPGPSIFVDPREV